jgi:UDP-N-acetyl-D-glucosamine dehydrogenase
MSWAKPKTPSTAGTTRSGGARSCSGVRLTRKDVDDPRESPGFDLMDLRLHKGALAEYNDPHIPILPVMRRYPQIRMSSQELTVDYLRSRDCVLIVTDHSAYNYDWIAQHAPLIVDTRNATKDVSCSRGIIVQAKTDQR